MIASSLPRSGHLSYSRAGNATYVWRFGDVATQGIDQIRASIHARLEEIRPLVAEVPRLEQALALLDQAAAPPARKARRARKPAPVSVPGNVAAARLREATAELAPYGLKADGTPRKRPAQTPEVLARAAAGRRRWAEERRARVSAEEHADTNGAPSPAVPLALHVQTMTFPAREMEGRELAWTTEAPQSFADVA